MTAAERALIEAEADAAEAKARALRRVLADDRTGAPALPHPKRKPQRQAAVVVTVDKVNEKRAIETAKRMRISLPEPMRKP